jgi:ABC-type methionine transport system ATPase subunit
MARVRVKFSYSVEKVSIPVIDTLTKRFNLVGNIRRAAVQDHSGWVVLQLDGEQDDIDAGLEWVREQGVIVDPVEGDIVQ